MDSKDNENSIDRSALKEWLLLSEETKLGIFNEISRLTGMLPVAVEKDWWVVQTLAVVFNMDVGSHIIFKGGTSLSKAYGLIDRFSEDIDLALDRKFLGIDDVINGSQLETLRKKSNKYISGEFFNNLQADFQNAGLTEVSLQLVVDESKANNQDPLKVEVNYPAIIKQPGSLQQNVLIEIGSRSLREPYTKKELCSLVGEYFKEKSFADTNITIPTVDPERTLLEKIFLLHEEFQKPVRIIKVNRLSRHLYDIEKIMDTDYGEKAFSNIELYQNIVQHRKTITPIKGIDYANHVPEKINIIPPEAEIEEW